MMKKSKVIKWMEEAEKKQGFVVLINSSRKSFLERNGIRGANKKTTWNCTFSFQLNAIEAKPFIVHERKPEISLEMSFIVHAWWDCFVKVPLIATQWTETAKSHRRISVDLLIGFRNRMSEMNKCDFI